MKYNIFNILYFLDSILYYMKNDRGINMFGFGACFLKDKVYIGHRRYYNNEILTSILNLPQRNYAFMLEKLKMYQKHVQLREDDYELCENYNAYAHEAQAYLHTVGRVLMNIPVYKDGGMRSRLEADLLFDCLNREFSYWEDGCDEDDPIKTVDFANEYGFCARDDNGVVTFIFEQFIPPEPVMLSPDAEILHQIDATNEAVRRLFDEYIRAVEDLLRVQNAYALLLDRYLNEKNRYLTEEETTAAFIRFLHDTEHKSNTEKLISGGLTRMGYEIRRLPDSFEHLCEANTFDSLGAFIYYDFFRGLAKQFIPRRCDNCGKYFLQRSGKYSNYCDNSLRGEPGKTCRDVGSRKKYDEKCKTDPIWLAYNRAYKTHYARYMKKKMTTAEFEQWSRYAVELRENAILGKIEQAEYERVLKK